MKRLCGLIALMALGTSAHADSLSFALAGHRIRIEAPRQCRSASCVSVSIPGLYRSGRGRDRDDAVAAQPEPAPTPQPPSRPQLAATTTQPVAPPPPPPPLPAVAPATAVPQPAVAPPPKVEAPVVAALPIPVPVSIPVPPPLPPISNVAQETEAPADTPLGDWQTEGNKGEVRIERCGQAMCGYVLNNASDANASGAKGDTVLINMKSKSDNLWSGNIYSRSSGRTYYAKMTMKGTNTLRVEACALYRYVCSGNDWTRIEKPSLISSRPLDLPPS